MNSHKNIFFPLEILIFQKFGEDAIPIGWGSSPPPSPYGSYGPLMYSLFSTLTSSSSSSIQYKYSNTTE